LVFTLFYSALVEKSANLKVMRVLHSLITFKFALLQGMAEQLQKWFLTKVKQTWQSQGIARFVKHALT